MAALRVGSGDVSDNGSEARSISLAGSSGVGRDGEAVGCLLLRGLGDMDAGGRDAVPLLAVSGEEATESKEECAASSRVVSSLRETSVPSACAIVDGSDSLVSDPSPGASI